MKRTTWIIIAASTLVGILLISVVTLITYRKSNKTPQPSVIKDSSPLITGNPVSFTTLARGVQTKEETDSNYLVINSQEDFDKLWTMIGQSPEPSVDFSTNTVIAVLLGTQPTGGYSTEVTEVTDNGLIYVAVLEKSPNSGCFITEALTSPYHLVTIPKTTEKVNFQVQQKIVECLS